jgi:hypothetical protein
MPFTFKPEVASTEAGTAPQAPPAFGNAVTMQPAVPSMGLMQRNQGEQRSYLQLFLFAAFGLSILWSLGSAGYLYYLNTQIDDKKAKLASYEKDLGGLPLENMRSMSNRLKVINQLVKQHPSVNVAFKLIEDSIENPITYNKFDLRYSPTTRSYELALGGVAPDYKSVVQQIDTLKREPYSNYINKVDFNGINLDEKGYVNFSLQMAVGIIGLLPDQVNLTTGNAEESSIPVPSIPEQSEEATPTPQ